ncbi:hypothetical protein D915_007047 [Fasciola hepatica]|uniref:Cilia-and flagella-associated protein 74 n=1 Tax=Fasciola hepatica TaxID=6192 RepID=A0A4E0RKF2_FASHE|nr:hypothetical protein D915_007047 [Fasciola hepatica]
MDDNGDEDVYCCNMETSAVERASSEHNFPNSVNSDEQRDEQKNTEKSPDQRELTQLQNEIKISNEAISQLKTDKEAVKEEITKALAENNMALFYRLDKKLTKLTKEMKHELMVNQHIENALQTARLLVTVEMLKQPHSTELTGESTGRQRLLSDKERYARESKIRESAEATMRKINNHLMKERMKEKIDGEDYQNQVKQCRAKQQPFLDKTMQNLRRTEGKTYQKKEADFNKAVQSVSQLKTAIENSRVRAFKEAQQRRRLEIVNKLLDEEQNQKKKLQSMSKLYPKVKTSDPKETEQPEKVSNLERSLINEMLKTMNNETETKTEEKSDWQKSSLSDNMESASASPRKTVDLSNRKGRSKSMNSKVVISDDADQVLSEFIFRQTDGKSKLKSKSHKSQLRKTNKSTERDSSEESDTESEVHEDDRSKNIDFALHVPSKLERKLLYEALTRTRENIVQPQKVGGRKFYGEPFMCSPKEIWFRDFDVNVEMQMKLVLTNASYKAISCRYVDMTETLLDFVKIRFTPPGALSPGMCCTLDVSFLPKLDRDLFGQVNFLCPAGPFSIPFRATTKKCDVSIDQTVVDFGSVVIGETVRRTVRLHNSGAKGVAYKVCRILDLISDNDQPPSETAVSRQTHKELLNSRLDEIPADEANTAATPMSLPHFSAENSILNAPQIDEVSSLEATASILNNVKVDTTPEFTICGAVDGFLQPSSTVTMTIVWNPKACSLLSEGSGHLPDQSREIYVIQFDDPLVDTIQIEAYGQPRELPTYLSVDTLEMGICWYDRLYQDCFAVHNRTNTALRVTFHVSDQVQSHMEVLPRTGFVQAQSRLLAQVKFLPRTTLSEDIKSSKNEMDAAFASLSNDADNQPDFDSNTGVLHVPIVACVAGQTYSLRLVMAAVVTTSDIELAPERIDFGITNITETVSASLTLTNHSLLLQNFGIVDAPEYVEIQPNDGFGTILPKETLQLELLFSPSKAKDYEFRLTCKTGIGRSFSVCCTGVGVFAPLRLSTYKIQLPPTPLDESTNITFTVENIHVSSNPYTHVQPRIGSKGPVASVGPTAYEFLSIDTMCSDGQCLSGDKNGLCQQTQRSFLSVLPNSGTLNPGEKHRVTIRFRPLLCGQMIREEAARMVNKKRLRMISEAVAAAALTEPTEAKPTKGSRRDKISSEQKTVGGVNRRVAKAGELPLSKEGREETFVPIDAENIMDDSVEYSEALAELLRVFPQKPTGDLEENEVRSKNSTEIRPGGNWPGCQIVYRVACFTADGPGSEYPAEPPPPFKTENTMFLEVTCPVARPALLVLSNQGHAKIDFGALCSGQQKVSHLSVQNISPYLLKISSKPLNPVGPFELLHVSRTLNPKERTLIKVKFQPSTKHEWCSETLTVLATPADMGANGQIYSEIQLPLTIKLTGLCVVPRVEICASRGLVTNPEEDSPCDLHTLQFGCVLVLEFAEIELIISNPTGIVVEFHLLSDQLPPRGMQNLSGAPVFMCAPSSGTIEPGGSKSVSVTFAPDHASDLFYETFLLTLNKQPTNAHRIVMTGMAKTHSVYIHTSEAMKVPPTKWDAIKDNYLGLQTASPNSSSYDESSPSALSSHLVIHASRPAEGKLDLLEADVSILQESSTRKILRIGCVASNTAKKSADFSVENINELASQGFSISPSKGSVEPGSEQVVCCTWNPTPDIPIGAVVRTTAKIVTKADLINQHVIHLLGIG